MQVTAINKGKEWGGIIKFPSLGTWHWFLGVLHLPQIAYVYSLLNSWYFILFRLTSDWDKLFQDHCAILKHTFKSRKRGCVRKACKNLALCVVSNHAASYICTMPDACVCV